MTDFRDKPDATDRWRATIDALEAVVLTAPDGPEIDPAEAEDVRRLVMVQTARRRRKHPPRGLGAATRDLAPNRARRGAHTQSDRAGRADAALSRPTDTPSPSLARVSLKSASAPPYGIRRKQRAPAPG
jgi:hypothetical protein